MTSKEALKILDKNLHMDYNNMKELDNAESIIEKDLDVLEIILKVINIDKEDLYYDDEIGYMFLGGKITKEESELLKEWLEK